MKRRLTVSRTHPQTRSRLARPRLEPVPQLRLQGRWLAQAGFAIGKPVRVAVRAGLLVLEVLDDETGR